MLKIPYERVVERIKEEAALSEEQIFEKIQAKMDQLSGLISKEGAAHIVANELGIKLLEQTTGKLQIKNIVAGLRNVEMSGKVMRKYELREFNTGNRSGKVASVVLGDETGTIRLVMWGSQAENVNQMNEGEVVKVVGGYVRENNGFNELHANEKSQLVIAPPGETIEVKQQATQRKAINELAENDNDIDILGTVVQVFEPRFFPVDPEKGKKLTEKDGQFFLGEQLVETPDYSYVLNAVIDDGTENMRAVFFRDTMERVLQKQKDAILELRSNPALFEDMKTDLLGTIVKINGRVKKNIFFDRLEFVANNVTVNPNPEDEIKRLDEEVKKAENS